MKLWIKYLIASLLGVACAFILPTNNEAISSALEYLTELVIRFGRYMTIPVMFFTVIVAVNKLRETNQIAKTALWTGGTIVVSSLLLSLVGLLSILVVRLPRFPITVEKVSETATLNTANLIRTLFPYSPIESLLNGSFLLASFLFAGLIGGASASDNVFYPPIVQLADSLSKLMYNIAVFFTEFLSYGMAIILCYWTTKFRAIITSGVFSPMILLLLVDFLIVVGLIYPLIIRYICHDPHPYRILYASICSAIAAFFSADSNLTLLINMRHGKESIGIRRRINGITFPLFNIFARGGSALVTVVGFIMIWRSYSSLTIPFLDILWITFASFGISFLLGGLPAGGAFVSLSVLCTIYGRGFETGFLLLKPAAPIICSFAAAFDALTAIFGSYVVAVKTKLIEHHGINHFI